MWSGAISNEIKKALIQTASGTSKESLLILPLETGNVDKKRGSCTSNIVITVTNVFKNDMEYKCIRDFNYEESCDWIYIFCNNNTFITGKSLMLSYPIEQR